MPNREESIQINLSRYLSLQYPNVIFTSEASGIRFDAAKLIIDRYMQGRFEKIKASETINYSPKS